jgi:hypothetical protein
MEERNVNKVVARFVGGRVLKGTTADFYPARPRFHVTPEGAAADSAPVEVKVADLKAVFFVRDFTGDPRHVEKNAFDAKGASAGRRIKVVFADGEVLLGTTTGHQRDRPGFFIVPADAESNIERCYVVAGAAREVRFI